MKDRWDATLVLVIGLEISSEASSLPLRSNQLECVRPMLYCATHKLKRTTLEGDSDAANVGDVVWVKALEKLENAAILEASSAYSFHFEQHLLLLLVSCVIATTYEIT